MHNDDEKPPVGHDVTVEFLRDRGFRVQRSGRSFIHASTAVSKPESASYESWTSKDLAELSNWLFGWIAGVEGVKPIPLRGRPVILSGLPTTLDGRDEAYRYCDDETLKYWQRGSIRLSSLMRFRQIENEKARDAHEGRAIVVVSSDGNLVTLGLEGGFSNYVLCLSSHAPRSVRTYMRGRFGPNLIRVSRLKGFAEKIRRCISAEQVVIGDVTYSDQKMMVVEDKAATDIASLLRGRGELTEADIKAIALVNFPTISRFAEAAAVFCKPRSFALESERRLSFQMPKDVLTPTLDIQCGDLVEHIELVS